MKINIEDNFNLLFDKNNSTAYKALQALQKECEESDQVYCYMEKLADMMNRDNSYIRTRGLTLIAYNAKWDNDNKIDEIIDEYLKHITDVKPITARQCIKLLPMIAKSKPELKCDIVSALQKANISIYTDSMRPLVRKDIQNSLAEIKKVKCMDYKIREIRKEEYEVLADFLYEAIFIPPGMEKPPKAIIRQPELQVYIADFGKADDWCLVAEVKGKLAGAVWVRIMNDYGHIDDETPSLAISLYEEYRNLGIGTALMRSMLQLLKDKGYKQTSLSVQKANYAVEIYIKAGFRVADESEEEYKMVCQL